MGLDGIRLKPNAIIGMQARARPSLIVIIFCDLDSDKDFPLF
jgi:hypothetical protein